MKIIKSGHVLIILLDFHSKRTETDSGNSGKLGRHYISV